MDFMEFVNSLGVATVPALVVIAFGFGLIAKAIPQLDNKWIPVICVTVGAIFGVLALYTGMAGFEPTDWITAMAVGIVSGFGATGVDQMVKQLKGKKSEETDDTVAALMAERQRLLALVAEYEAKQESATEAFVAEQEVQ